MLFAFLCVLFILIIDNEKLKEKKKCMSYSSHIPGKLVSQHFLHVTDHVMKRKKKRSYRIVPICLSYSLDLACVGTIVHIDLWRCALPQLLQVALCHTTAHKFVFLHLKGQCRHT